MRIPGLLVLLLSGLLVEAAVPASAQSQSVLSPSAAPTPGTEVDLLREPDTGPAIDQYRLPVHFLAPDYVPGGVPPVQDTVCYTLRSYRVERSERFSDGDGVIGYSTCQPSTRFEFKQAVQTVTDSK